MRNKNVYMYIVLILIIIFSFAIPSLVMKLTEEKIFAGKYEIYKKVYALNNKANKNDIIKAIRPQTYTANLYLPNEGIYGDLVGFQIFYE